MLYTCNCSIVTQSGKTTYIKASRNVGFKYPVCFVACQWMKLRAPHFHKFYTTKFPSILDNL